jgi:hypothetical protein
MQYSTNKSTVRSRRTWNARTGTDKDLHNAKAATNTVNIYRACLALGANKLGYFKLCGKAKREFQILITH